MQALRQCFSIPGKPRPLEALNSIVLAGDILTTESFRKTYIRLLIDRFINISSKIRKEVIPNKIREDFMDYIADSNVVLGFIMDYYVITNNDKGRNS